MRANDACYKFYKWPQSWLPRQAIDKVYNISHSYYTWSLGWLWTLQNNDKSCSKYIFDYCFSWQLIAYKSELSQQTSFQGFIRIIYFSNLVNLHTQVIGNSDSLLMSCETQAARYNFCKYMYMVKMLSKKEEEKYRSLIYGGARD